MQFGSIPTRAPLVPAWVTGLWQRASIALPDGSLDRATRVLWGQTRSLYVDIRIPMSRPQHSSGANFSQFSLDELRELTKQKGFAGHLVFDGTLFRWERYIDYRPPTGRPDEGRLRVEGDTLYEEGDPDSVLGVPYKEVYHRIRPGTSVLAALRSAPSRPGESPAEDAVIVIIDDQFLYARGRAKSLSKAQSLEELVRTAGDDRPLIEDYLNCEISYGSISDDLSWRIELSTLPFREGCLLMPEGSRWRRLGELSLKLDRPGVSRIWHVAESNLSTEDLARLLNR